MRRRYLLAGAVLSLSLATLGNARSWDVVVDSAARAGHTQLPAGDYSVKFNGNQAVFKNVDSGKTYNVPVKIDTAAKKYDDTAVLNTKQGNTEVIQAIELEGTTTKLEFGE